jgi:translation initiation factor 1
MGLFAGTPFDLPPRCERCEKLESECNCPPLPPRYLPPGKQTAKLRVEKRPRGKSVTVLTGLAADANDLPALLTQLKNACGAGGALKADTLEIQGDHLARLRAELEKLGYRVKA